MRRSEYPTDSALERLRRFVTGNFGRRKDEAREKAEEPRESQEADEKRKTGEPD